MCDILDRSRQMSLIERKKRQWAQERAEMRGLCTPWGLPWGLPGGGRGRYGSSLDVRDTCPASAQRDLLPRRRRSPSLPPLPGPEPGGPRERSEGEGEGEGEGETSGYASDSAPQSSPELWRDGRGGSPRPRAPPAWRYGQSGTGSGGGGGGGGQERLRWGDRGMAAGRLWEPQETQDPSARLPQMIVKGTPSWVERGLNLIDNGDSQILIIDQQSNHSSGGDGSTTADHYTERNNTTYMLGQNVPIEPNIKAERESRRIKALELQAAIMEQLEERQRKKKQEKERRIREEREEEDRFRRQRELERQRLDEERKILEEKRQREQKRAETLRQAFERAEQQAKLEKENKKNKKLQDDLDALSLNSEVEHKVHRDSTISPRAPSTGPGSNNDSKLIQNIYIEQAFSPRKILEHGNPSYNNNYANSNETRTTLSHSQSPNYLHTEHQHNEKQTNDTNKNNEAAKHHETVSTVFQGHQSMNMLAEAPLGLVQIPLPHELFTPVHFAHGHGVQMAFLLPPNMNNIYPCIHQPINMQSLYNTDMMIQQQKSIYQMQSQTDTDESCSNRENKVLTPSKYRNPNSRDVCTQTDLKTNNNTLKTPDGNENDGRRMKSNDVYDQNYEHQNTSEEKLNTVTKKEKRFQLDERFTKELENRPKWGVNKPPTQYKKQSEKDMFYAQKRKLRQRKRIQESNYTSHSSDDNRSPSPPREIFKQIMKTNDKDRMTLSENHWRKKNMRSEKRISSEDLIVETTQISPLECDKSGVVHVTEGLSFQNHNKYHEKLNPKRGITLSQKFMNDKYGNPKLWHADPKNRASLAETKIYPNNHPVIDVSSKAKDKFEDRKMYFDTLNKAKREQSVYYCESDINQPIILDQLRSLRDSLKNQQKIWGKYENAKKSPSPKLEVDLEME